MKETIRKELKHLLPGSGIDSIFGSFHMKFELGGEGNKDCAKRIKQATHRGLEIYKELIGENEVILLIEEWENSWIKIGEEIKGKYLASILQRHTLNRIKGPFQQTYIEEDSTGKKIEKIFEDDLECDLSIGKVFLSISEVEKIIRGIASLEMGGEPFITQSVYFFFPKNQTGFRIYDDRGCDVWSNSVEELRNIYENFNDWLLDYYRKEIDAMFE